MKSVDLFDMKNNKNKGAVKVFVEKILFGLSSICFYEIRVLFVKKKNSS